MSLKFILYHLSIASLLMISCSNINDEGDIINENMIEVNGGNTLTGEFVSVAHPTSGTASINSEETKLSFTNFKTDAGPLLEVWMVSRQTPTTIDTYVSLGNLKGIEGNFIYDIPNGLDIEKFNHVVIWCVQASVSFGYAVIE